ncbi:MAG: sugar phosphate isomerase/epimerase [Firmicutes bacterium]|nr:sugar phosphate isomerase/epimerase [Bacillota bacterium]
MKKGIRGHDVTERGIENICKKCLSKDITYLQLVLEKSIEDFKFGEFTEEYANSIKAQIGNVKIAILGSYINPSNPNDDELKKDIEKFKEKIRYASILKPIAVGTETGIYKEGLTNTEEAYQRVLLTFKELTKEVEKFGVSIAIEGVHCFVINTPKKLKRLLDDLNSDNVKVIFDPVNYLNIKNYKNQDEIIRETFDLLWDKICVIHAKDFIFENGEFCFRKPTEGLLNYKLIFEKMKEYNLEIPIICEEISDSDAVIAFRKLDNIWRDL